MQTDVLQFFDLARGLLKLSHPSISGQPTPYRELHELNRMRASLLPGRPIQISFQGDREMMTQAEIIVLFIIVLGTVTGGLRKPHPSLVGLTDNKTSIAAPNSGGVPWHTCSTR
jgi:hypothetical protein